MLDVRTWEVEMVRGGKREYDEGVRYNYTRYTCTHLVWRPLAPRRVGQGQVRPRDPVACHTCVCVCVRERDGRVREDTKGEVEREIERAM